MTFHRSVERLSAMSVDVVGRAREAAAVAALLDSVVLRPCALVVSGEPGMGKTTLWFSALEQARGRGLRVLSARPVAAELQLAYASVADLLSGVEPWVRRGLPGPQRLAIDQALLRSDAIGVPVSQRAVGAALLSVLERLTDEGPVLLAIDDLQWLDSSSVAAIAFAVRRLTGRLGVLGTVRAENDGESVVPWLQLSGPDAVQRVHMGALSLGALHRVLAARIGGSLPRPALVRIQQVSRGNPFYALELARTMGSGTLRPDMPLPGTLGELVQERIAGVAAEVRPVLLAAASVAEPTVELVQLAIGASADEVVVLLEDAERNGVIGIEGHRLWFAHPLLAAGVYSGAAPAQRRAMHRRLAEIVEVPELRARHLALAAVRGDPETLRVLDDAAVLARARGAPAAAAELVALGVGLGGGEPPRLMSLARYHLDAGDAEPARRILEEMIESLAAGTLRAAALSLLALVRVQDDGFVDAAELLRRALGEVGDELQLRVQLQLGLSHALVNQGVIVEAVSVAEDALAGGEQLGQSHLLSQALALWVMLRFLNGHGLEEASLARAVELEDARAAAPVALRPTVLRGVLQAWTGCLEQARETLRPLRRRCIELGEETDLIFIAFQSILVEIWRGNYSDAALIAEDSWERALLVGADVPLAMALSTRAMVAGYTGQVDEASRAATDALAICQRCGWQTLADIPLATLAFVNVSLGDYSSAMAILEPLLTRVENTRLVPEIVTAVFVPDAVEALIQLGRLEEAAGLVDGFERHGRRFDRAWTLALGGRCRAMLLAAQGELDLASRAAQQAMVEHTRLPMPFESARTQLLLGQLRRRRRQKDAAAATLREVVQAFDDLGTVLWAARARNELGRVNVSPVHTTELTLSERRVAELAATGLTNREVAASLFISPKTVEANLARVYHKLGIHSRAELGQRMLRPDL